MKRSELIGQLRQALCLAESPREDVIEFDIAKTTFVFDFTDEQHSKDGVK